MLPIELTSEQVVLPIGIASGSYMLRQELRVLSLPGLVPADTKNSIAIDQSSPIEGLQDQYYPFCAREHLACSAGLTACRHPALSLRSRHGSTDGCDASRRLRRLRLSRNGAAWSARLSSCSSSSEFADCHASLIDDSIDIERYASAARNA